MSNCVVVPEILYMIFLLVSWISGMFSGIAFVYGIFMKKERRSILPWAAFFAVCLVMVFLLMKGFIVPENMIG